MLILRQLLQQVEQLLRIGRTQLGGGQQVAPAVVGTVDTIVEKLIEAGALVELGISTSLVEQTHILVVCLLVGLGMLHQVLQQGQCLGHVLAQSVQRDIDDTFTHRDFVVAGQLIELLLHLLGSQLVSAQVVKIVGSIVVAHIGLLAKLIAEG